jgi:hypothetical protein
MHPDKKSSGSRAGKQGSQMTGAPWPIHVWKILFNHLQTCHKSMWEGVIVLKPHALAYTYMHIPRKGGNILSRKSA